MIQLKVVLKSGDDATWLVDGFTIFDGVLTYWVAKTSEEIGLDMDDIVEISVIAVPVAV